MLKLSVLLLCQILSFQTPIIEPTNETLSSILNSDAKMCDEFFNERNLSNQNNEAQLEFTGRRLVHFKDPFRDMIDNIDTLPRLTISDVGNIQSLNQAEFFLPQGWYAVKMVGEFDVIIVKNLHRFLKPDPRDLNNEKYVLWADFNGDYPEIVGFKCYDLESRTVIQGLKKRYSETKTTVMQQKRSGDVANSVKSMSMKPMSLSEPQKKSIPVKTAPRVDLELHRSNAEAIMSILRPKLKDPNDEKELLNLLSGFLSVTSNMRDEQWTFALENAHQPPIHVPHTSPEEVISFFIERMNIMIESATFECNRRCEIEKSLMITE